MFPAIIAAHWMMFFCHTSLVSWRTLALSRVLKRTLMWRSLQKCWKLTFLDSLKLIGIPRLKLLERGQTVTALSHFIIQTFLSCSVKVCEMMFSLASKLATARTTVSAEGENDPPNTRSEQTSQKLTTLHSEPPGQELLCLKTQTEGATAKVPVSEWESQEKHLLEMFPKCSLSEARSALSIAKGDMEEAVRLIIEGDVQLSPTPPNINHGKSISSVADQKLKESILEKYMLVDREEDKKIHRPVAPKDAPKKLVRYHGNQVVTTKGERYQLVKKNETEDMKKTYVSLKPARKYRFH
uniref:CUE domain containing 2 n=1 Tax=Oryzias latipes TaxID=8090 RepID=A0A3P9J6X2_ORYLA